jgi:SRSO17 transposase
MARDGRRAETSALLYGRLYRPKARIDESHRAAHVKRPPGIPYRRKTAVAEELIDQGQSWEVPARPLVADAFYGNDFGFRQALRQRQVAYVVEVESSTSVWTEDPNLPWPPPKKNGRPRQYLPLEALPRPRNLQIVAQELPAAAWQHVTWGQGRRGAATLAVWRDPSLGGPCMARAATPAADGRVAAGGMTPNALEPVKYGLAPYASQPPDVRRVGRIAKGRWRVARDDRELQEALGLDPDEGRHGLGWHHHVCLVHVAQACLRSEQAQLKKAVGVTLPLVRRYLHAVLMRLIGCCPRCHSQFEDSS